MLIKSFWASGYRSLQNVRLTDLGPFVVFYGPNGSGKSNTLDAIRAFFRIIASRTEVSKDKWATRHTVDLSKDKILSQRDFSVSNEKRSLTLGATIDTSKEPWQVNGSPVYEIDLEVTVENVDDSMLCFFSRCSVNGGDVIQAMQLNKPQTVSPNATTTKDYHKLFSQIIPSIFSFIRADRYVQEESTTPIITVDRVSWHLRQGHLKKALFEAQNGPNARTRRRLKQMRELLSGPPLNRSPFTVVFDPTKDKYDLREVIKSGPEEHEISIDISGLGVVQVYTIVASAMLNDSPIVALEEPESHLHAPTSGVALRQLLRRMVSEGYLHQLFVATHSNLFDLDDEFYWDVSFKEGTSVIEKKPRWEIDGHHLYEPGPAKRAIQLVLRGTPPDKVIFHRGNEAVTASQLLEHLEQDDALAVEFLRACRTADIC